ncbi:MAG: hypothetical protein GKC03_04690 [Methanomassiliicoccales archaeon]|nr:hypothetical protein [Methanomassiliicoccales archaeon]NYT15769.1 hypothetical protein [Methanomassiliicoccales archaeon]
MPLVLREVCHILPRFKAKDNDHVELPQRIASSSIDQIMNLGTVDMDGQARILVFFDGHVDEGRLARAARLTIEAEPMLGYRFVDDRWRPYWQLVDEKDWSSFFTMVECLPSDLDLFDFMIEPVLPEKAPQIRVGLFRSDCDILCIRSNHVAIDGGGAIHYLSLLASLYRELEENPHYCPKANTSGRQGPRQVLKQTGLLPAIRALSRIQKPGSGWGISRISDDLSRQTLTIRQIGPERLAIIRSYAREKGVTMNDVLLTAFCRSLFIICDPPLNRRLRVEAPTNLRRYLPEGREKIISDISAVYFLTIDRRDDESFEETLQRVHQDMDKKKRDRVELAEMLLLELALLPGTFFLRKLKEYTNFKIAHPALSNLGMIDPEAVDFGHVPVKDLQMLGPTLYPPNIGMGVSTFRQTMTLSLSYCDSAIEANIMDRFLNLFLDELPGEHVASDLVGCSEFTDRAIMDHE